jgi:hypothetical protein
MIPLLLAVPYVLLTDYFVPYTRAMEVEILDSHFRSATTNRTLPRRRSGTPLTLADSGPVALVLFPPIQP